MSILDANDAQVSAITHVSGPMLVIAGPGSGKTYVVTERIRYLIEEAGVPPHEILVITFSAAAAREMQERYQQRCDRTYAPVQFGTFHAVFFHILQHTYQYRSQNILRNEDRIRYFREIIEENQYRVTNESEWMQEMAAYISRRKSRLELTVEADTADEVQEQVFRAYQQKCEAERQLDFDDMLLQCYRLLCSRPEVLQEWRQLYRYIMVDEFQDINRLQYEIIRLLAGETANLFAVGDDDQSIYGFRGARPEMMQSLLTDYPNTQRVTLNKNYRSTEQIVNASERLIRNNRIRFEKHMKAVYTGGEAVCIRQFQNQSEELDAVIQEIQRLSEQFAYEDMAVLYRTGIAGGRLAERMLLASIPFQAKERLSDFYCHSVARDMMAYAALATGDRSRRNFFQIMNKPKRYLSRAAVKGETFDFGELLEYYRDKAYMTEALLKLKYDLRLMREMEPYSLLTYIAKGIGYERYLSAYAEERKLSAENLTGVFEELKERAAAFHTVPEWLAHIEHYEEQLKRGHGQEKTQGVTLSTIHAAKGLEYSAVWIPDVYEGNLPHVRAATKAAMEEERRIFYVAMTRAKQRLYLFYPEKEREKSVKCSRFLTELRQKQPSLFRRA